MHKIIKNWEKFILKLCKKAYESQTSFKFILGSYPKDIADVYTNNPKIWEKRTWNMSGLNWLFLSPFQSLVYSLENNSKSLSL